MGQFAQDAAVKLYYDGSKKFETLTNGIKVTGRVQVSDFIETFTNDTDLKINSAGSSGQIKFYINGSEKAKFDSSGNFSINNDSGKITVGTGSDLQIYHDGSNSFIADTGTGGLILRSQDLTIQGNATTENLTRFIENGGVELYYDNVQKINTNASGVDIGLSSNACHLMLFDGGEARFGTGQDLKIKHDGTNSYLDNGTGNLYIYTTTNNSITIGKSGEISIKAVPDAAVELYYDNSKKFETTSDGVTVTGTGYVSGGWRPSSYGGASLGSSSYRWYDLNISNTVDLVDNGVLQLGTGQDLRMYHNGSNSIIKNNTGYLQIMADNAELVNNANSEYKARFLNDAAVELYYDGSKKFATTSGGVHIYNALNTSGAIGIGNSSNLTIEDNGKVSLGTGDDLKLYHTGSHSYVINDTGVLHVRNDGEIKFQKNNGSYCGYINPDGGTIWYHNSSARGETTSGGWYVYGTVTESSDIALKKDITPLSDSLAKVKQLKGYSYKFKETDIEAIGFTAQDVEKIYPALVEGEEGKKGLNYSGLIAPLVEAIKELSTKIETLETKVAALEAK